MYLSDDFSSEMANALSHKDEKELKTKIRIMQGALGEFKKFGYSKVTMDEIATALGMSKKTIYKHFQSKEDLLMASVGYMQSCFHDEIKPIFSENIDFIDKMMKIGSKISQKMCDTPPTFLLDIEKNAPEVWEQFENFRRINIRKGFTDFLELGIAEGEFRTDFPKELLVEIYYILITRLFQPSFIINSEMNAGTIYFSMMRLIFEGMLTGKGRNDYFTKAQESAKTYDNDKYFLRTNE